MLTALFLVMPALLFCWSLYETFRLIQSDNKIRLETKTLSFYVWLGVCSAINLFGALWTAKLWSEADWLALTLPPALERSMGSVGGYFFGFMVMLLTIRAIMRYRKG